MTHTKYASLGERIRDLRQKAGLSQRGLALKLGIANQSVWIWEKGVAQPEEARLPMLADILGVTVEELVSQPIAPDSHREVA